MFRYRFLAMQVAQDPKFLSPRHMADLPERRIDDGEPRTDHLPVIEIGDEGEGARAKFAHSCDQLAHAHGTEGIGSCAGDRRWHWVLVAKNSRPRQFTK